MRGRRRHHKKAWKPIAAECRRLAQELPPRRLLAEVLAYLLRAEVEKRLVVEALR